MAYCGSCGGQIPESARFCKHCGADQAPFKGEEPVATAPPPSPAADAPDSAQTAPGAAPPSPLRTGARESAERVAPGSPDLAQQLVEHLRAPGVALAGLSALIGVGACLAAGLVLAIALPNASYLAVGGGSGALKETLAQAVAFSQANLNLIGVGNTVRTVPVLFVLIPIGGIGAGVAALAPRTAGMQVRERMLWGAAAGVPFAFAMLILALGLGSFSFDLFATEAEFANGSVFLLSLVWGALGGMLGMLYALRQEGVSTTDLLPEKAARPLGIAWSALRPLLLALLAVGAIGTAAWVVQVIRVDSFTEFPPRSTAVAVGEQISYAGDHAIDILPLGAVANERLAGYPAIPIEPAEVFKLPSEPAVESPSSYNLFDFNDTMAVYVFVPMLIALIAIPALLALYAGFAVARRVDEWRPERAALWGAVTGPIWALAMVLVAALARKDVVGNPKGDSIFIAFLLGGALLGALGGLLSAQGPTTAQQIPPPPAPTPGGVA